MEPILTTLNINIGQAFMYDDVMWIRTDRYVASSPSYGACKFGYLGEDNGSYDEEWKRVLDNTSVIDMDKMQTVVKNNIDFIKV